MDVRTGNSLMTSGWESRQRKSSGIHSACMLMLATVAFEPTWKGDKGLHWFYYVLDAPAGYTFWPIYWIGVFCFIAGLVHPGNASRSRFHFIMIVTLIGISAWYAGAALFMKFCPPLLAYIPAIVCVPSTIGSLHQLPVALFPRGWQTSFICCSSP